MKKPDHFGHLDVDVKITRRASLCEWGVCLWFRFVWLEERFHWRAIENMVMNLQVQ